MSTPSLNGTSNLPPALTNASSSSATQEPYSKSALTKEKVLETIRQRFPLTTLFTPELKIELGVFIKDQMLMRQIAEFLLPLVEAGHLDKNAITFHFMGTPLLGEIQAMFKQDTAPLLPFLYEACADALYQKATSNHLKDAIEGRIFTLKNSLIAQHTPELVLKNQIQNNIEQQNLTSIKEEGASFIRESLRLHLDDLRSGVSTSFRELLISTAKQLIPFVKKITRVYLIENRKDCPDNPLTFRNPTGYNYHGGVAASVMEDVLSALGYKTRMLGRTDLEPKVTLAPGHDIVEVAGPSSVRYLIDPCYVQFHKDVCIEDKLLPTAPVLVLDESEVDRYIDENLMVHWKSSAELVQKKDAATVNQLNEKDQILPFVIDQVGLPKEIIPSNVETWVKKALKRVWDLSTYTPILSNVTFQEIFYGEGKAPISHNMVKSMGLGPLTHLSFIEVERRLGELLLDPNLKGQNSVEALSLLAQLPKQKRFNYASLLDLDPRIKIEITLNAYFCSLKKIVNPEGMDKKVIYGCSGADCMTVLLATDANDLTFVDKTSTSCKEFEEALTRFKKGDSLRIKDQLEKSDNYLGTRSRYGGAMSRLLSNGEHQMKDLALKIFFDLQELGVDLNQLVITSSQEGMGVQLDFLWQYHGAASPRMRRVTFISADITQPDSYPAPLKAKLEESFDIFYMKGAFLAPQFYPQFLPHIAKYIRKDGWLMTADKTSMMDPVNPEPFLEEKSLAFERKKTRETQTLEELTYSPYDALFIVPSLDLYPPNKRLQRTSGSDLTYWALLTLRQKI